MILATVLIYAHLFTVGYAFTSWPARMFMIVFMVVTFGAIIWGTLVRPFLIRKRTWIIKSVTHPHPDVVDLQIIPETSRSWSYHAGQFAFLTFLTPGLSGEAHPFTIASAPSSTGCLRFLIKQCGDFTTRLSNLCPADRVLADGPFGVFSLFFQSEKRFSRSLVFIAGGIGITPFLAMLEALSRAKQAPSILLVWSVQKKEGLFLSEQFSGFRQSIQELEIHYFVTRDPSYQGATQRMNSQSLRPLLEERTDSRVFVCGPPGMNRSVLRSLAELGFDSKQVITERFSL
jgi:3-phenylpropionate/trans-cinnamate dioxygenase ferredoxin reductase subunit